jgi:hypothetical protein
MWLCVIQPGKKHYVKNYECERKAKLHIESILQMWTGRPSVSVRCPELPEKSSNTATRMNIPGNKVI